MSIGVSRWDSFIPVFVCVNYPLTPSTDRTHLKAKEDSETYEFMFRLFQGVVREVQQDRTATEWVLLVVIRDHATAIINACRAVFGEGVEDFVCFFPFAQREEKFFESCKMPIEYRTQMQSLSRALHMSRCLDDYKTGLMHLEHLSSGNQMWEMYAKWLRGGHHLPGCANQNWVYCMAEKQIALEKANGKNVTRTQNGIERYHRELRSSVRTICSSGHPNIVRLCEVLAKYLFDVEAQLQVGIPGNDLPAFYSRREEQCRSDLRRAEEMSADYLRALQIRGTPLLHGKVSWTRDETGKVKIFCQEELDALHKSARLRSDQSAHQSLDAWYRWQNVVVTSETSCDCVLYRKNPFSFCRHSVAVRKYLLMTDPCLSPLTPSPSQAQRTECAPSLPPYLARREPLSCVEPNSTPLVATSMHPKRRRSSKSPSEPCPRVPPSQETNSWHHPSPRRTANSLRAMSEDLGT